MQRSAGVVLRRAATDARGTALVEFALCLPVLILLYTGGCCVSDMLAASRKVTIATRSLVDLTSRSLSPSIVYNDPGSINGRSYLSASAVVLSPYKLDKASQEVSLVRVCDATHAYVLWTQAQTQNADGSTTTPVASSVTAGTLPKSETQSAANVIPVPANMISTGMIPVSPDGSNVCGNLAPGTSTKTQVGTAGGWLYMGTVRYDFTPSVSFVPIATTRMTHTLFMTPRLF
ncbi:MAG: TadE/TadG family type IV pilus assembly protein [Sphingomonas adhaesiva]|uniref:TadE/TadG family type IV pilus assembly protein n=1 Tax=Sphingomonas adhaesiva TaxID=28212 RepID=UPI002FF75EB5